MLDALREPFMQRALLAGVLIALVCGYFGVFVVQRGMSFLGDGLAHAAFGGVALGLLLRTEPLWVALPFTVVVALGISWLSRRTRLGADTSVGIFFSVSVALGVLFLSLRPGYSVDAFAYLFGSILSVSRTDLVAVGVLAVLVAVTCRQWSRWAYATFDRELALTDRVPVGRDDYLLAALLAVSIVVAVKLVGIVLVTAFLVIPPAAARQVSGTFRAMTLLTLGVSVVSAVVGLLLSYALDIPSGSTVILTQATLFVVAMSLRPVVERG